MDASGQETSFTYTSRNQTSSITKADGTTEYYTYDLERRCSGRLAANGSLIQTVYNLDGNPVRITGSSIKAREQEAWLQQIPEERSTWQLLFPEEYKEIVPKERRLYAYAPDGRLMRASEGRADYQYTYDRNGRLIQKTAWGKNMVSFTYDRNGNLRTLSTPGGSSVYAYNAAERIKSVSGENGVSAEYRYNRNGMQTEVRFGNGLRTCYQYDSSNQLTGLKAGFLGQETILESRYQYDGNGNRVRKEEYLRGQPQSIRYQYDSQDRLTRESRDKSSTTYRYDAAGNRLQKEQNGAVETYIYDSRNRLLERSEGRRKVRYMYDAAGNLTQEQHDRIKADGQTAQSEEIRYAYDTFGRTAEVSGSTFQQKNRYDAEGFRYELEENKKVSRFVYHRGMMLAELDETNQVTGSQYLGNGYLGGKLLKKAEESTISSQSDKKGSISKETGKGFSSGSDVNFISKERELCYYIRDEQGSVRYVVDQGGNVVNEYQYRAFGETERAEERYENRLCYNGQIYDGLTEQYYLRARYYQPKTGRFTQEDFLYEDGLNLYAYCKSNPVMYCDPRGLAKMECRKEQAEKDGVNVGSNTNPIQPYEVTTYEDFRNRSVVGDGLEGHELWQHANIKENGYATTRLSTDTSKQNPVIALPHEDHIDVNRAQNSIDARNQLPIQNVVDNANILYDHPKVPNNKVDELLSKAIDHINNTIKE